VRPRLRPRQAGGSLPVGWRVALAAGACRVDLAYAEYFQRPTLSAT